MINVKDFIQELSNKDGSYVSVMSKNGVYMLSKDDICELKTQNDKSVGVIIDIRKYEN